MTLNDFLVWLSGAGCVAAASWLLGKFPWYNNLAENIKQLIFFVIAAVFGIGAYAVITYVPAATLAAIGPYFVVLAAIFSYVFGQKLYARLISIDSGLKSLRASLAKKIK